MKNRAFAIAAVFAFIIALSSCGSGKEENSVSAEPSVSSGAIIAYESPDVTSSPEVSAEPSETAEASAEPSEASEPPASAKPTASAKPKAEEPSPSEEQEENAVSGVEFSFKAGDVSLTLQERDISAKLKKLPFSLVSDYTEVLGEGNDTFTGSSLRTITYDGFILTLLAPKDSNDDFWLMQMTTTSPDVQSHRGIKVGDSLETFLQQYPDTEISGTEDAETYIYTGAGDDSYAELAFIISDNTVTQISLNFYMP